MKKVVVIGGSGFMGSHTSDELSKCGYEVVIFDRVKSPWLREDQRMIIGDMLDYDSVLKAIEGASIVYHFAGIADIGEAASRPFDTIHQNVMGATVALDASIKAGVKRFVYASTMYVYSHQGSFYRASKQSVERIIEAYSELYGLEYTLLRYGSLYGPRAQEWNGLSKYVHQIVIKSKLEYHGNGKEKREYIHVLDAARLSVKILDPEHCNQAITVTGQQAIVSDELIDMMFEITGQKKNVKYISFPEKNGHYTITPYRYTPKAAKKIVPDEFIDLGQGILDIIEEVSRKFT
jgi:UDP-glucose 4-epimerase